MNVKIASDSM